jgi:hypothetical protein
MSTAARRLSMICAQTLSALGLNQLSDYGIIDGDRTVANTTGPCDSSEIRVGESSVADPHKYRC